MHVVSSGNRVRNTCRNWNTYYHLRNWKSCEVHVLEIVHVAHVRNWNTEEHVEEHISKQGGKIY